MGVVVILVAFGLADGDGQRQIEGSQKVFEIGGVLPGGIDADVEFRVRMSFAQAPQLQFQALITHAGLRHG